MTISTRSQRTNNKIPRQRRSLCLLLQMRLIVILMNLEDPKQRRNQKEADPQKREKKIGGGQDRNQKKGLVRMKMILRRRRCPLRRERVSSPLLEGLRKTLGKREAPAQRREKMIRDEIRCLREINEMRPLDLTRRIRNRKILEVEVGRSALKSRLTKIKFVGNLNRIKKKSRRTIKKISQRIKSLIYLKLLNKLK